MVRSTESRRWLRRRYSALAISLSGLSHSNCPGHTRFPIFRAGGCRLSMSYESRRIQLGSLWEIAQCGSRLTDHGQPPLARSRLRPPPDVPKCCNRSVAAQDNQETSARKEPPLHTQEAAGRMQLECQSVSP